MLLQVTGDCIFVTIMAHSGNRKVRVRFAPSPTGPLHMGGVRTALYNYLFARQHQGDFILRIEDTDRNRWVPGAEEYIIESLRWCGILPNEGVGFGDGPHAPYRQSERQSIYRKYAEQLVQSGHAYYAFDTPEELEKKRKELESGGSAFAYNAANRQLLVNSLTLSADDCSARIADGEHYVIRLKIPEQDTIVLHDLIRGEVAVESGQLDDKVLFKGDGMPTYHLANVVDDYLMNISHVIRGEEWLPSAPVHVLLYRFLGWEKNMPQFAHLPLLLKPDGNGKLSKRDGDRMGFPVFPLQWTDPATGEVSSGYRENGYYPEAFVNVMALLGWHPADDQELFSMDELIRTFSLERVHKSGAKFDPEKTRWFNEQYLRKTKDTELAFRLSERLITMFGFKKGDRQLSDTFLLKAVHLLKERVQFESEMTEKAAYLFVRPDEFDQQVIAKKWKRERESFFRKLLDAYASMTSFDEQSCEAVFQETAQSEGIKAGEVLQLFRVFLSGQGGGVRLFGMAELLGKDEVRLRLEAALEMIKHRSVV